MRTKAALRISLPLRKQCQEVGGQEKLQPMSSSSDREDQADTAELHSLLVCKVRETPNQEVHT